ncbi:MAG: hypothetical protein Q8L14_15150 [Myxococcales bacterium]|nr:hypothetical protein [Myxococcales bacterium]
MQTPSAEPLAVPVRQLPLHHPHADAAVQTLQVPLPLQGSAVPPPLPELPPPAPPG